MRARGLRSPWAGTVVMIDLRCFGIGNSFCNNLFVGSYVLLRDGFIMLQLCHLGACLAVAPAAAAAGWLVIYARTVYKDPRYA